MYASAEREGIYTPPVSALPLYALCVVLYELSLRHILVLSILRPCVLRFCSFHNLEKVWYAIACGTAGVSLIPYSKYTECRLVIRIKKCEIF
jgi:hypothetical protein